MSSRAADRLTGHAPGAALEAVGDAAFEVVVADPHAPAARFGL